MDRRQFTRALAGLAGLGGAAHAALGESDAALAVRAALVRGATAALAQLGRNDGFLGNPKVHIGLPDALAEAARLLSARGHKRRVDDLIVAMNRAAETALPAARPLLLDTVRELSVEDALALVQGGRTAITDFFVRKTRAALGARLLPIVSRATAKVGLARRHDTFAAIAARLGLVRIGAADLTQHVTAKGLDGLYLMMGEEEMRIRDHPGATGSTVLKQAFGG